MTSSNKRKISFKATKIVRKPVRVKFVTSSGDLIEFPSKKKIKKPVRVTFYAKKR